MFIHSVYSKQYSECGSQLNLSELRRYRKYRIATYRACSNIRVTPCVKTLHRQDRPLPTDRCPPPPQPNTGTCLPFSKPLLTCSELPGMANRSWWRATRPWTLRSRVLSACARVPWAVHDREPSHRSKNPVHQATRHKTKLTVIGHPTPGVFAKEFGFA